MKTIIIGGGQAATSFAARLRSKDADSEIIIIGDEPVLPYQRPPLSKAYLGGEMALDRLLLRPQAWYDDNNVTLRLGVTVNAIDRQGKTIALDDGTSESYDKLVLATGSRARDLPETVTHGASNVYTVRSLDDVDQMKHEFTEGRNLVVVGAGYIGLEAAAIARKFGLNVTVIEAAERILMRVACVNAADYLLNLHHENGAEIVSNAHLTDTIVENGKITAVKLADGREIQADFMIVGIGIVANEELATDAGLKTDNGIIVDDHCRTDDPDIFAAGDCTRFLYDGDWVRLESVGNAIDMAEVIADNIAGEDVTYEPKPWFWSDQYDITVQIAGLFNKFDDLAVRPGMTDKTLSYWYYREGKLIAVAAMSEPRAYLVGKRLIEAGKTIPPADAANPDIELKDFLKA